MKLLTVNEAARQLSLSSKSIRRLVADGDLVAYKVRGRILISAAALEELLARSRVAPRARQRPSLAAPRGRPGGGLRRLLNDDQGAP